MLKQLTEQLAQGGDLSPEQVAAATEALASELIPVEEKADFLTALARKGETVAEIAEFARDLRNKAVPVPVDASTRAKGILDVCGAGGDYLGTFNVSTTAAFVLAGAGVVIAKHGNRAVTSKCGSADVIEALGVPVDHSPESAAKSLADHGFAFLFATRYHPAFKHIAPARRLCAARGQRTVFNFLGPMLNPARPDAQLVGMPSPDLCEPIGRVLQSLEVRRAMVASGAVDAQHQDPPARDGIFTDELSTLGANHVVEYAPGKPIKAAILNIDRLPIQKARLSDLGGGDARENAEIVRRLLRGEDHGPRRDVVLLNVAAALVVAGKAKDLETGWAMGAETVDSGAAIRALQGMIRS